jgi:hypothetical protein
MDEHVELVMGGAELVCEGTDRVEVLEIGQAVADARGTRGRRYAVAGPLGPAPVAGQEVDRGAAA